MIFFKGGGEIRRRSLQFFSSLLHHSYVTAALSRERCSLFRTYFRSWWGWGDSCHEIESARLFLDAVRCLWEWSEASWGRIYSNLRAHHYDCWVPTHSSQWHICLSVGKFRGIRKFILFHFILFQSEHEQQCETQIKSRIFKVDARALAAGFHRGEITNADESSSVCSLPLETIERILEEAFFSSSESPPLARLNTHEQRMEFLKDCCPKTRSGDHNFPSETSRRAAKRTKLIQETPKKVSKTRQRPVQKAAPPPIQKVSYARRSGRSRRGTTDDGEFTVNSKPNGHLVFLVTGFAFF